MRLGLLGSLQKNFDKLSMLHTVCNILYFTKEFFCKGIEILLVMIDHSVLIWLHELLGVPSEKQKLWKHHFQTTAEMDSNFLTKRYV